MAAAPRIGFCFLMSKTFRPGQIDAPLLLPPCVQDFVGEDHLPRFVVGLVVEHLDLREIGEPTGTRAGGRRFIRRR